MLEYIKYRQEAPKSQIFYIIIKMANIGISELIFIFVLAFIILGPEELMRVSRTIGLLTKKLKKSYQNIQMEINNHLQEFDLPSGNDTINTVINKNSLSSQLNSSSTEKPSC